MSTDNSMHNLNGNWAISLPVEQADSLIHLYNVFGLEVLPSNELIWVRGSNSVSRPSSKLNPNLSANTTDESSKVLENLLRGILGAARFDLLDDGQLVPAGNLVPNGRIPDGDWQRLADWIQPCLPPTALMGMNEAAVGLAIVRATASDSRQTEEPNLLICDPEHWLSFVESAAKIRLDPLSFVFDASLESTERVVVRGTPLPTIPGQRFILRNQLATPTGWSWSPAITEQTVLQILRVKEDETVLFQTDGSWSLVSESLFVQTTRTAVRATFR